MIEKKVICVVPVFNEEDVLKDTIQSINRIENIDQILIVNDGSTDRTLDIIKELKKDYNLDYITYEKNKGKGYAVKKAISYTSYSHLVLLDGDVGKSGDEIESLINISLKEDLDLAIAKFPSAKKNTNKKGGLGLVKGLAKNGVMFFTGQEVNTSLSGQRVYKKDVLDTIEYIPNNYGIEVAMTVQTLNNGFTLKEVPVNMTHRYTDRSLKGFIHRGKQFRDILKTFIVMLFKGYKR